MDKPAPKGEKNEWQKNNAEKVAAIQALNEKKAAEKKQKQGNPNIGGK